MSKERSTDGGEESWNMARAYLQRVDMLLSACAYYQMHKQGEAWYQTLFALYKELYPKLKAKEKWQAEILLNQMRWAKQHPTRKGEHTKGANTLMVNSEPFVVFELFLRSMLEEKKLLTPKGADPTKSFTNG